MEWKTSRKPVPYEDAVSFMEERVRAIREAKAGELIWLLEHPALFTAGASAKESDLIDAGGLPVYHTGRGGQYTWHGPGQRVAYVMLDLKERGEDVRHFVKQLESWIIATLACLGVESFTRNGRVGVWVDTTENARARGGVLSRRPRREPRGRGSGSGGELCSPPLNNSEAKIAAIGVRIRKWVSYHGIAINVNPDLKHYQGIVPCGIREYGVTSLAVLRKRATLAQVDKALKKTFAEAFG